MTVEDRQRCRRFALKVGDRGRKRERERERECSFAWAAAIYVGSAEFFGDFPDVQIC